MNEVTAHYDGIVRGLDEPPVIIGHSFGRLITKKLLDRGLGAAGVAVHPAPIRGILGLPPAQLAGGTAGAEEPRQPAPRRGAERAGVPLRLHEGLHQITPYGLANSHDDAAESWSPDGSGILFAGIHERFNGGSLYVVHTDGTGLRAIALKTGGTKSVAFAPGWSPDGSKIIFSLFTKAAPGTEDEGIYTANADGSGVSPVASGGGYDSADWGTHALAP